MLNILNKESKKINKVSSQSNLEINAKKTKVMVAGRAEELVVVTFNRWYKTENRKSICYSQKSGVNRWVLQLGDQEKD